MPPAAAPAELRSRRFLLGSLLVLVLASLLILAPFLSGTLFALVGGFLLQRPFRALARWVRWRPLAAFLLVLLVVVAICLPLALATWRLVGETQAILERASEGGFSAGIRDALTAFGVSEAAAARLVTEGTAQAQTFLQESALDALGKLPRGLANVGIFVLLLYFAILAGEDIGRRLRRTIPLPEARRDRLLRTVGQRVRALFLGTFLVALIQGIAATLGWWLLGFPNPLFWGFVMTVLAVIPVVGPILVMAPAGALAILDGRLFAGAALIVYGLVVVGLIDNLARPFVIGRSSSIHPALVLLGTLGGLVLFGITGFILGPLILSMVAPLLDELEASNHAADA